MHLEDDTEDDSGFDSDSNSMMAPEEVEAVYNIWGQMPEKNPLGVNSFSPRQIPRRNN